MAVPAAQVELVDSLVGPDLFRGPLHRTLPLCIIVTQPATPRATSMSCSMRISVIAGSSFGAESVSCAPRATALPRARRASSASGRWRAPCPPRAGAARRVKLAHHSVSVPSRPTRSAIAQARSRMSVSARERTGAGAPSAHRAGRGRDCPRRSCRKQPRSLERARQAEPGPLAPGSGVTSRPNSSIPPVVGGNSPEITLKSGLAGAVGTENGSALAALDLEVHVAHGVDPAERSRPPEDGGSARRCRWFALRALAPVSCRS